MNEDSNDGLPPPLMFMTPDQDLPRPPPSTTPESENLPPPKPQKPAATVDSHSYF